MWGLDPFLRLAAVVERVLVRLAVLGLIALVVGQAVIADPAGRWLWTFVDPLEAAPEAVPVTSAPAPLDLTLGIEGGEAAPGVAVLVNGRPAAVFAGPSVTVRVSPGDEVAVDARCCRRDLWVRVLDAGPGLVRPAVGLRIRPGGGIAALGRVEWRRSP